jgi:hypothetical protein
MKNEIIDILEGYLQGPGFLGFDFDHIADPKVIIVALGDGTTERHELKTDSAGERKKMALQLFHWWNRHDRNRRPQRV